MLNLNDFEKYLSSTVNSLKCHGYLLHYKSNLLFDVLLFYCKSTCFFTFIFSTFVLEQCIENPSSLNLFFAFFVNTLLCPGRLVEHISVFVVCCTVVWTLFSEQSEVLNLS